MEFGKAAVTTDLLLNVLGVVSKNYAHGVKSMIFASGSRAQLVLR